jgi:hypothetical protein
MIGDVAVVLQPEIDAFGQMPLRRSDLCVGVLLRRERDAGDLRLAKLGEIDGQSAPAAADVEDAMLGLDQQLGGQVPLLGELGIVERLTGCLEVRAAILPVSIQKQRVELSIEIIMVGHVPLRALGRIELQQAAIQVAQQPLQARPARRLAVAALSKDDGQYVGDRALLDHEGAIDVSFAKSEFGVQEDAALCSVRHEPDGHRRPAAIAE